MQLEWDEAKRQKTLRERGINFADLKEVFETEVASFEDTRFDYDEPRYILFGFLRGKPLVVVHSFRANGVTRIISARFATKNEQRNYYA